MSNELNKRDSLRKAQTPEPFVDLIRNTYPLFSSQWKLTVGGPALYFYLPALVVGIPKSVEEMKAMSRQLKSQFSITQLAIDDVKIDEPSNGLVPIEVSAKVVKSSSEGPMQPTPIRFRYLVGARKDNQLPIVAKFDDLSGQPATPMPQ